MRTPATPNSWPSFIPTAWSAHAAGIVTMPLNGYGGFSTANGSSGITQFGYMYPLQPGDSLVSGNSDSQLFTIFSSGTGPANLQFFWNASYDPTNTVAPYSALAPFYGAIPYEQIDFIRHALKPSGGHFLYVLGSLVSGTTPNAPLTVLFDETSTSIGPFAAQIQLDSIPVSGKNSALAIIAPGSGVTDDNTFLVVACVPPTTTQTAVTIQYRPANESGWTDTSWTTPTLGLGTVVFTSIIALPPSTTRVDLVATGSDNNLYYCDSSAGRPDTWTAVPANSAGAAPNGFIQIVASADQNGNYLLFALDLGNALWVNRATPPTSGAVTWEGWALLGDNFSAIAGQEVMAGGPELFGMLSGGDAIQILRQSQATTVWTTEIIQLPPTVTTATETAS